MKSEFETFLDVLSDPNPKIVRGGIGTLRYCVEMKTKPTFTASKCNLSIDEAKLEVKRLRKLNKKSGYTKYSNFKLYGLNNILIQEFTD